MARGRLRMYLGAAPVVGKTYEMLLEGHRQRAQGVDCMIGFVEPHGRRATEALVEGLEVVPRREVPYRGGMLPEMDLDAVLARHPQLALIDELAHTNAPGSRHLKRWQDIEELLVAGIDVMTTLNIQHLESLGDVLTGMTGVRQRETVTRSGGAPRNAAWHRFGCARGERREGRAISVAASTASRCELAVAVPSDGLDVGLVANCDGCLGNPAISARLVQRLVGLSPGDRPDFRGGGPLPRVGGGDCLGGSGGLLLHHAAAFV